MLSVVSNCSPTSGDTSPTSTRNW